MHPERAPAVWHVFADATALRVALGLAMLAALEERASRQLPSWWLLSGGTTPAPLYRQIAPFLSQRVASGTRINIGLVDDRWVPSASPGSNARLLRESLLVADRPQPELVDLCRWGDGIENSLRLANANHEALQQAQSAGPDLVLFGMGEDGHTASLFPGSPDLPGALAANQAYVALDATGCPVSGEYPHRITLTPAGWQRAQWRVLLVSGERKREVLTEAFADMNPARWPVVAALNPAQPPLHIYWAP